MKRFFLLSFLMVPMICSAFHLQAQCSGSGYTVFPSGYELNEDAVLVLNAQFCSRDILPGLNKTYPVYLKSGSHKVPLHVREIHPGQSNTSQAVLVPERNLTAGLRYTLVIDHLPEEEHKALKRLNPDGSRLVAISYKVKKRTDRVAPVFTTAPKEYSQISTPKGTGYATLVQFSYSAKEESPYLVKVTVRDTSGTETVCYVEPRNRLISLEYDTYGGGAFTFKEGASYQIHFSLMDASGNVSPHSEEWVPLVFSPEE